jgi:hypothetical protein
MSPAMLGFSATHATEQPPRKRNAISMLMLVDNAPPIAKIMNKILAA